MARGGAHLLRATRARAVRSLAALSLVCTVASTGFVALAAPALADVPAPTLTASAPTTPSSTRTPVVDFVQSAPTYECRVTPPVTAPWTVCTSPWTVPSLSTDGTYSLNVRQQVVGDVGQELNVPYALDTKADVTLTKPASPGNDPTPHWGLSLESGGSATCVFDGAAAVPCTGGFTAPTLTTEVTHTLVVTPTDGLGNVGPDVTSTYLLDTTPPTVPVVAGPTGTDSDTDPTWSWANADGDPARCTLHKPGGATTGPVACTSGTSYRPHLTADGAYSLDVDLTDSAGNTSTGSSATYTLDTTPPPVPTFVTTPPSAGTAKTVTWTFNTAGTTTSCVLVGTSSPAQPSFSCKLGTATVTLPNDDSWKLVVTASDPYGNTSSTTSPSYLLDTTGPTATVTGPMGLGNDAHPHYTWDGEIPSSGFCRLVGASTGPWIPCDVRSFDPVLTADGDYTVDVQLQDSFGNLGPIAHSQTYTYDGTQPTAPALSTPATPNNDTSPTITFSVETNGTARCTAFPGTTFPTSPAWTPCTSGSYSPTLPSDGQYTLAVEVIDEATNIGDPATFTYDLDTAAPTAVTVVSPTTPGRSTAPQWTLTGDGSSVLTCTLRAGLAPGTTLVSGPTTCTGGSFTADLSSSPDGDYTFTVVARDTAGNTTTTTSAYHLDTQAPSAPAVVTGPAVSPGNAASPSWTFATQPQTTAACRLVQGASQSSWSDCSSGTYTVPNIPDGTYTVDVLVTDLAGNDAPTLASSGPYQSDRTAPAAPVVTGPTGSGNDPAPTWTWTGESGAKAMCRVDRAGVIGSYIACNAGTFKPALTGDTSYVVAVFLTDAAGNVSPVTTLAAYNLDTSVPANPVISGPSGSGKTASVIWTWTSESGATSTCTLVRNGTPGTPATCTSGTTRVLPSDATYALQVQLADAAGNSSGQVTSATYKLDRVAPAPPVVSTPASPSKVLAPSFALSAEANATLQCRLLRGSSPSTVVRDWATCTSPVSYDLTGLPDGTYYVEAVATDLAGNTGTSGSSLGYVLDTTPPDPPIIAVPANPSQNSAPTFTWPSETGATSSCRLVLNGVNQSPAACTSPYSPTLPSDGSWVLRVRVTDAAGNTNPTVGISPAYVLDTTAPTTPVVSSVPATLGRATSPTWSATYEANATTECKLVGPTAFDWSPCTLPLTTSLGADGTYVLSVRVTDEVGLVSGVGSATYKLDTNAPAAPVFTAQTASPGSTRNLSFAFTSEAGSTVFCKLTSGTTVVDAETPCTSPLAVDLSGLAEGAYTLSARAVDAAGNAGPTQTTTYVLDVTAPAAPTLVSAPAATSSDRTPTWAFSTETGAKVTCTVTGSKGFSLTSSTCTSPFSVSLVSQPDDTYTFTATAKDLAGNTGPALVGTYVLDSSAPTTATVVAPASPGRNPLPTWQVSSSEGTVQCTLLKGAVVVRDWTACGPTFSLAPLVLSDGTYVMSARVVDSAGNLSAEVKNTYVLDTVAPAAAKIVAPASPSTDRNPTFTISSPDPGVTASCRVVGPSGPLGPFAPCAISASGSPYGLTLGTLEGAYTLTVQVKDAAGNAGPDATATYVLDLTNPNSVLVSPPAKSPSNNQTPTWTYVGDSDATLECQLSGPGFTAPSFSACPTTPGVPGAGSYTADLTAKADGTYTLTVRSRDAAGNLGPETSKSYDLDTAPPPTPAAPVVGSNPSTDPAPVWTFSVVTGDTALCTLSTATSVIAPEAACTSPLTTNLPGDGTYTLAVRDLDSAGNTSAPSSTSYVLDRVAPGKPLIIQAPGSPSSVHNPTWGVETAESGGTLQCWLSNVDVSWRTCPSPLQYELLPAKNANVTLQVRQVDTAGNASLPTTSDPYVYDDSAPAAPVVMPPVPALSNNLKPSFSFTKGDADSVSWTCTVTRFDRPDPTTTTCSPGAFVVDLSDVSLFRDGLVTLSVTAADLAGNQSTASATYHFDNTPPIPAKVLPLKDPVGLDPKVTWSFGNTAEELQTDPVTYRCAVAKQFTIVPSSQSTPCTSPREVTLSTSGTSTLWVWAVDRAGNYSVASLSDYLYLPPVPTVTGIKAPVSGPDSTPTWTFTIPRGGFTATCLVSDAHGSTVASGDCTSGRFTPDLSNLAGGVYSLTVQLSDSRDNVGTYSARSSYRYVPATSGDKHLGHVGPIDHHPGTPTPPDPTPITPTTPTGPAPHPPGTGLVNPVAPHDPANITPPATTKGGNGSSKTPSKHDNNNSNALGNDLNRTFIPQAVPDAIGKTLRQVAQKPTIPLVLLVVVVGFLLLQNRIDRRDPKLASAPVGAEPELDFGPVQRFRNLGGGAPA